MKLSEMKNLSDQEIDLEVHELRDQLFHLRSQAVTEKLQKPTDLTKAKRDIARLLTVKRQRQLAAPAGQ
jgi:large subunit ribosomal protein L29